MTDHDNPTRGPEYWGPGGPPDKRELVDSWTPGRSDENTWGPYHLALFPPHKVTPWIRFKTMSTVVNIARRLWNERETRRLEYEAVHGDDSEAWPVRHPGIVLESAGSAHAACLGCQWLDKRGTAMANEDLRTVAADLAMLHQRKYDLPR